MNNVNSFHDISLSPQQKDERSPSKLDSTFMSASTIRFSRRENESTSSKAHFNSVFNTLSRSFLSSTYLEDLVIALQSTSLPGPVDLTGPSEFLGEGGQFVVYSENMLKETQNGGILVQSVAAKQPKFEWNSDQPPALSDSKIRKHLRHVYLEIMALTMPGLRDHPNIIRLHAWSMCALSYRGVPQLVMELATSNLTQVVSGMTQRLMPAQKLSLCLDVADALDAIHRCGLIHGDLKPDNVLIVPEGGHLRAKLADFGLCLFEQDVQEGVRLGGTPGWTAPEVQENQLLDIHGLVQAETFSYGLLFWRVMLHQGKVLKTAPTHSASYEALQELTEPTDNGEEIDNLMRRTLPSLLAIEPSCRPKSLAEISGARSLEFEGYEIVTDMASLIETKAPLFSGAADETGLSYPRDSSNGEDLWPLPTSQIFGWEMQALPQGFESGLRDRFSKNPHVLPVDLLLGLFLWITVSPQDHSPSPEALSVLNVAALRGSLAARAILPCVHRFFQARLVTSVDANIGSWLDSTVMDGSMFAAHERERSSGRDGVNDMLNEFRRRGGYHVYFDRKVEDQCQPSSEQDRLKISSENFDIKVKYGTMEEIHAFLNSNDPPLIHPSASEVQPTLVYLACMRGSWPLADMLIQRGCRVSTSFTPFNLDCLHWLFAIDESLQPSAVSSLIEHGVNIDCLATEPVPFPHYPFVLPPGSPLHWATILSCQTTISCLLKCGANVLLRDGSDPYNYDTDIRVQTLIGDPVPDIHPQGLSPLDYAAMQFDPLIFQALTEHNLLVDINDTDEEGHSVLHRLSSEPLRHTRLGISYCVRPMQGSWQDRYESLEKTLRAIMSLGGDLELLTKGGEIPIVGRQEKHQKRQYTPLMLAVQRGQTDVVRALLNAGASVHTRNPKGETALFFKQTKDRDAYRNCIRLLCEYGADVQVRDSGGETPVCIAATTGDTAVVDFMLSHGADIDSRYGGEDNIDLSGQRIKTSESVFSILASAKSEYTDSQHDYAVAQLLEKHVLTCQDEAKRMRVLTIAGNKGQTLLYKFSTRPMPLCVAALLKAGVDVNATSPTLKWTLNSNGESVSDVLRQTALDGLAEIKRFRERMMQESPLLTIQAYEHKMKLHDETERTLRAAGGVPFVELSDNIITIAH